MVASGGGAQHTTDVLKAHGNFIRSVVELQLQSMPEGQDILEDVIQDFYVTLLLRSRPEEIEESRAYLYKATIHHTLTWLQRYQQRNDQDRIYSIKQASVTYSKQNTDTLLTKEQVDQIFDSMVDFLPQHQHQAVLYRYKYGLNDEAAAQRMGINLNSFYSYVNRGLRKLRKLFRNDK